MAEVSPATEPGRHSGSSPSPAQTRKRFIRNQIPDSVLNDTSLNAAISSLPSNYNFEIHKSVWRIRSSSAKRVALQFPEGLLIHALSIADIFTTHAGVSHCFVFGDVTYGACCVDDFSASALNVDLLIHYGHSCLVPVDATRVPCLYVFVEIEIDVSHLVDTVLLNCSGKGIVLAGTIQFVSAIREAKCELEQHGLSVLVPQSKPLSRGEVLGCTAPKICGNSKSLRNFSSENAVLVFVADGRFHLEALMIANPEIKAFRYDPYLKKLFLEEYDHQGMRVSRRRAIEKARGAKNWGIVVGTLGRQGNPRILQRLEKKMKERNLNCFLVLMSEINPSRIALFEDTIEAWVQIACPRLSIDWGEAFEKPLLTPFEAEIALSAFPGWWEKKDERSCPCAHNDRDNEQGVMGDYPMDYYSQEGGDWNACFVKKVSSSESKKNDTLFPVPP